MSYSTYINMGVNNQGNGKTSQRFAKFILSALSNDWIKITRNRLYILQKDRKVDIKLIDQLKITMSSPSDKLFYRIRPWETAYWGCNIDLCGLTYGPRQTSVFALKIKVFYSSDEKGSMNYSTNIFCTKLLVFVYFELCFIKIIIRPTIELIIPFPWLFKPLFIYVEYDILIFMS